MENAIMIPVEKCFYAADGKIYSSLEDLLNAIPEMEEESFLHHLNSEKNDYYNWISEVLKEEEFANSIKKVKTKTGFVRKIKAFQKQQKLAA